jgi:hypothetical protein
LWSNGKKNDAALLAPPLFAPQFDLPGSRRQFPLLQLRLRHALSGLLTLRAHRWLLVRRPHLPIRRGMLFQEKRRQLIAQQAGQVFTLRKRHQLILVCLAEHSFKGFARALQPALAEFFPILPAQK